MTQISPSRTDQEIKVFGIQTLLPRDIMNVTPNKHAIPVLPKMYDGAVNMSIGCAPMSPIIGTNGYLDGGVKIGHCHSQTPDPTSNCNNPVLQMTAPSSYCTSTADDANQGVPCTWTPIDSNHQPYKQVRSNSKNPYGNLIMSAPTADQYLSPEWTTILNGGGCNYPPFTLPKNCPKGSPGMSPATLEAHCAPSRFKCTYPPGTGINIYDYVRAIGSPGFKPPHNPCISLNPTTTTPAAGWKDATCSIFYDVLTRAFVSLDTSHPELGNFPVSTDIYKPALFNNVPFNYDGAVGVPADVGSYCYVPPTDSCPQIGDIKGKLHGIAKETQRPDWYANGFNEYDNSQHLLCEYRPTAGKLLSDAPGGFIKTDKDFYAYLDQKVTPDGFFANYQGFPYNDTIYQYIMLEKCLEPVKDEELKDCLGIDGNFGPVLKYQGLKKNPIGMLPETYWNDAYRLDPMLDTKPLPSGLECTSNCYLRKMNELCAYSPSPCSTCVNTNKVAINNLCSPGGTGTIPPEKITQYCTTCQQPIVYSPDSPRCARMNKSGKDGQACRAWYKNTANNYHQAIVKSSKHRQNPEYTRAIYYNNCLRYREKEYDECLKAPNAKPADCGTKISWLSPCGPITTAPATGQKSKTFTPPEQYLPYPPILVPGKVPIYKPGPPPSAVDWDATRKELRLGNSPGSISAAFNKKAKEFCSQPSSKYLWECGCINASAESPANQNHYWNIYNSMHFAPAPPDSKYKEGYFSATKDQEDAKYCWLQPCKYPFGAGGLDVTNLNDPVRLGDLTLGLESTFQNKSDLSVCPEYDCESIIVTTPDSFIDQSTMTQAISAVGADQVCSSARNAFWIQDPVVCAFGPSANSLTPYEKVYGPGASPNAGPPGYVKVPEGQIRDPGNWCYDSAHIYAPGSPARKVKWSDQTAYMLEQMCFNGCHNYSKSAVMPQQPQPYNFPTYSCTKSGCIEYLPDSPANQVAATSPGAKEGMGEGEFFDADECKKECMVRNKEEKRELWYIIIIVIAIIAGIFVLLAIRKFLKYKGSVQRYEEKKQKGKTGGI